MEHRCCPSDINGTSLSLAGGGGAARGPRARLAGRVRLTGHTGPGTAGADTAPGYRRDSRHRSAAGAARLAQVFWHLESVADRPPDGLGVYSVRESALDRAPAEFVEHEVLGHALRIPLAELRVHPCPEFGQPHVARVLPVPDQTCAADKPVRAGDRSGRF
jgi:hypothetical protein